MFPACRRIMSHYIKRKKKLIKSLRSKFKFKIEKMRILLTDKSTKRKYLYVQD